MSMDLAKTILGQIKAIDPRALMAWDAKDYVAMGDGLRFKSSGMVKWKGYVYVKYDVGQDLYNIEFSRVRGAKLIVDNVVEGVFVDSLVEIIDAQVG
jgi:hypothetical protein